MDGTQFLVVRHGETAWNLDVRWQGHLDSPLTARGIAQAEALARRLREAKFSALYSSDLGRAYETARIISNATGHGIVVDGRLRERNLGIFQGLRTDEIQKSYPEEYRLHKSIGADYVIPAGESLRQQVERNVSCLEEIAQERAGESIVVVTHGGVLGGLFRHTLCLPFETPRRFESTNGSINIFVYEKPHWVLQTWGDISHLDSFSTLDDL
ncbi:MAG: histidine phosphatase family protein [Deltaproteobacteria bacterium]|nr:histidine phosphatase family protein [Deltaproteobacteria bacterium]